MKFHPRFYFLRWTFAGSTCSILSIWSFHLAETPATMALHTLGSFANVPLEGSLMGHRRHTQISCTLASGWWTSACHHDWHSHRSIGTRCKAKSRYCVIIHDIWTQFAHICVEYCIMLYIYTSWKGMLEGINTVQINGGVPSQKMLYKYDEIWKS